MKIEKQKVSYTPFCNKIQIHINVCTNGHKSNSDIYVPLKHDIVLCSHIINII